MVEPSGESRHLATGAHRVGPDQFGHQPPTVAVAIADRTGGVAGGPRVRRLRLEVAASYFPAFDRNPHTADAHPRLDSSHRVPSGDDRGIFHPRWNYR